MFRLARRERDPWLGWPARIAAMAAEADAAAAIRGHWVIENRPRWVLDVTFADDQSRTRKGYGGHNMATVRHFALDLVRTAQDKWSIKSRRKIAGSNPDYLDAILSSHSA